MKRRCVSVLLAFFLLCACLPQPCPAAAATPANALQTFLGSVAYYGDRSGFAMTAEQARAFAAVIRSEHEKRVQEAPQLAGSQNYQLDEQIALFDTGSGIPAMLYFCSINHPMGMSYDGGCNSLWQWIDGKAVEFIPNIQKVWEYHLYSDHILCGDGNYLMMEQITNMSVLPFGNGQISPSPSTTALYSIKADNRGNLIKDFRIDGRSVSDAGIEVWMNRYGNGRLDGALAGKFYLRQGVYSVVGMTPSDKVLAALGAYADAVSATGFTDVSPSAYYADAVEWALDSGITKGLNEVQFGPDRPCTRAQVVTFLWRAAGSPKPKEKANPFTDVKPGAYYYDAVLWALEKGVTQGVGKTRFAPDSGCTRGQIVTFLWRANGAPGTLNPKNPFSDVSAEDYFYSAVLWAVRNGVTNGTSKTAFSPDAACTRGQVVTFLYRAAH